ncbi:NUDIX hydrolase family protein [Acidocella sp.]|uniref:NUDIX hydrolase n=1 Tax=Acidocella sp. TaxID=50710 RepID=UPI0017A530F7|nr:NUDIX domain-containing protein [Acidocella sp.]NNM55764.1 NUDIX domain-containing protein [Acidocella sp.]
MASDTQIAKLLSHISACHSAALPGSRLPLYAGAHHIGYVTPGFAARLAAASPVVTRDETRVLLAPAALPELNNLARAAGLALRAENFDVRETDGGPVLAVLDRGALPSFGVIGVGVHMNGLVRRADGWHLWIAKRAANKKLDPGKYDNLVAGGVASGHTPFETIIKESEEEAALPAVLAANARQVARFAYNMERPEGLRRDVVYAYDLELPESFIPEPADGEVESFALWPLARVLAVASTTDDFKFNVNLVLIDLLIRFGMIEGAAADRLRAALNG